MLVGRIGPRGGCSGCLWRLLSNAGLTKLMVKSPAAPRGGGSHTNLNRPNTLTYPNDLMLLVWSLGIQRRNQKWGVKTKWTDFFIYNFIFYYLGFKTSTIIAYKPSVLHWSSQAGKLGVLQEEEKQQQGGVWCPSVLLTDGSHTFLCIKYFKHTAWSISITLHKVFL